MPQTKFAMKKSTFSEEQIVFALRQQELGTPVEMAASQQTFCH